jgi:AcrR family transcriptional regulator
MRVTTQTKQKTRIKILEAAVILFRTGGYEKATTRKIAEHARIGLATLFNYFPTKEAIVADLAGTAFKAAREKFDLEPGKRASLAEDLFALIARELRHLKPCRTFLTPLFETTLGPLANSRSGPQGDALHAGHLEIVRQLAAKRGLGEAQSPVALQLYWTLYTGVLAHWTTDESPRQEDTLAVLDESLAMYAGWLEHNSRRTTK